MLEDRRRVSAEEFFKERVEKAIANQHVPISPLTSFYLVQLLASFLNRRVGDSDNQPLAITLAHALTDRGMHQHMELKKVGDVSLFTSGFFSDSLKRKQVDVDYYIAIGGFAYGMLSKLKSTSQSSTFAELAEKFLHVVDILAEISEHVYSSTNKDLLRLYEVWLRTDSRRTGQLLKSLGVVPNPLFRKVRLQ